MVKLNQKEINSIFGGVLGYRINAQMLPVTLATTAGAYITGVLIREYVEPYSSKTVTYLCNLASSLFYFGVGGTITRDKQKVI